MQYDLLCSTRDLTRPWPKVKFWYWLFKVSMYVHISTRLENRNTMLAKVCNWLSYFKSYSQKKKLFAIQAISTISKNPTIDRDKFWRLALQNLQSEASTSSRPQTVHSVALALHIHYILFAPPCIYTTGPFPGGRRHLGKRRTLRSSTELVTVAGVRTGLCALWVTLARLVWLHPGNVYFSKDIFHSLFYIS